MFNSLENKSSEDMGEKTEALTLQTEEIMIWDKEEDQIWGQD